MPSDPVVEALAKAARDVTWYDFCYTDPDVQESIDRLREALAAYESARVDPGATGGVTDAERAVINAGYNPATARAIAEIAIRAYEAARGGDVDGDKAYKIGTADGYTAAIQDVDRRTGGDGEYVYSTLPGEGCPDAAAMLSRIVERFERLNAAHGGDGWRPIEPTEEMLIAARVWSYKKYGKPIGNGAATGCWRAMFDAFPPPAPLVPAKES